MVSYALEKAHTVFEEAREVANLKRWNLTGNRLYYAFFHMATAMLLLEGVPVKSHSGKIQQFNLYFIKTGLMDVSYGQIFARLFQLRQSGDYDDMFNASEQEIIPYFPVMENFFEEAERIINERLVRLEE